jgi:hypothetical protein
MKALTGQVKVIESEDKSGRLGKRNIVTRHDTETPD